MPPIDNDLAFFNLLLLYCCLFWGCPCGLGSGYVFPLVIELAPLWGWLSQLAARSALRFLSLRSKKLGLAFGHCYLSLSLRPCKTVHWTKTAEAASFSLPLSR